ncbi:MAG: GIY-YIG nuclease family protein [Alphaproteobacteria bacterium]|jgi:hypothetical protein|nr:GIY-YIG nuclease family protein [Alphaproteobacteria bacterium]
MELNDLLQKKGIDPESVLVLRHRPTEQRLCKRLPWLAAEKPALYNAYQQTQTEKLEKAMLKASYVASFIGNEAKKALFVGLYSIGQSHPMTYNEYWRFPAHIELQSFGMRGFTKDDNRPSILFFDLALTDFYQSWKGKMVIDWPPPERSWWRRASRNNMPVLSIFEDSVLDKGIPEWEKIILSWDDLKILPARWVSALSQWRAIYYIFDVADGKGYVGSAYGKDNLWRRWARYAETGHGGNRLLRSRDPQNFHFSILQRVSPDMNAEDIIQIENTWKERLHTRHPHGLNDN